MNFKLDSEQMLIRETVRKFAKNELAPRAAETDEKEIFPRKAWEKLGSLGLAGLMIPQKYGGIGMNFITLVMVMEELGSACIATAGTFSVHVTVGNLLNTFASEYQKEMYLPEMAAGAKIGALSISEPNVGSDIAAISTTAKLDGDKYRLNGLKVFVTSGGEADYYVIIVKTDVKGREKGLSAFLLLSDTEGLSYGRKERKMGYGGSPTRELVLEDCVIPKANLLGEEGNGFSMVLEGLNGGRISVGALALGIARSAYEFALSYAKSRVQFGRTISEFQGIQWKLADMAINLEASRWVLYHAAFVADSGRRFVKEASIAKCLATDTAMQITNEAVQILGGYGYTKEFPVERYMREAKIFQIVEGTNEIQRNQIAKEILG